MGKTRVGFFTDSYLPNVDGVVRSLLTNKASLEARGHFVSVYASGSREAKRANADKRVHYFTGVAIPFYKQYKFALHPFPAIRMAKKERLEVVHCHGVLSMGMAAKATASALKLPLVGTFHTLIPRAAESYVKPRYFGKATSNVLWRVFARFYNKGFDLVTAPSATIKRELLENGVRAPLAVIPNAVDCKRFKPAASAAARAAAQLEKKKFCPNGEALILCAGRLGKEKNVDVLVRAMPSILEKTDGKAKLVITGEGPSKLQCQKLAAKLGLWGNVLFTGFVEEKELPLLYGAADVFASASTFETQGLALLEAMACGTPCAAARAMAFEEEVRNGRNGELFEPFDESDCAEKIFSIISASGKKRRLFAREARASALEVDVPLIAKKWEDAYEAVKNTKRLTA